MHLLAYKLCFSYSPAFTTCYVRKLHTFGVSRCRQQQRLTHLRAQQRHTQLGAVGGVLRQQTADEVHAAGAAASQRVHHSVRDELRLKRGRATLHAGCAWIDEKQSSKQAVLLSPRYSSWLNHQASFKIPIESWHYDYSFYGKKNFFYCHYYFLILI